MKHAAHYSFAFHKNARQNAHGLAAIAFGFSQFASDAIAAFPKIACAFFKIDLF